MTLCLFSWAQENPILHLEEVISDSAKLDATHQFHELLNKQAFISDIVVIEKKAGKTHPIQNKTGLFILSLVLILGFAAVRQMMSRHLNNLFGVFFKFQISKRQLMEQLENDKLSSWILNLVYFLCLGFLIFKAMSSYTNSLESFSKITSFGICSLIAFGLYLIKIILIKIISWVFQQKEAAEYYLFNTGIVNEFASIFLFPICIIMLLKSGFIAGFLLNLAIILLIVMFLYRYVRTFGIAKKFLRLNFVHFLLYLCTFEIMPLLIVAKWISKA